MRRCLIVFLALLVGCATPYHRPPATATLLERQRIYAQDAVTYHWFGGFRVGRKPFQYGAGLISNQIADYFAAGGDQDSAAMAREATPYYWLGLALGVGGLAVGVIQFATQPAEKGNWLLVPGLAGVGSELLTIHWSNGRYLRPAADSYNRYLQRDLGLPEALTTTAGAKP
jgi:hypothetical protein